jgi:hypothetical protein
MHVADVAQIRKAILENRQTVANTHRTAKDKEMYVIIKPTATSVFRNFVDLVDEMHINKVNTYAIDDKYLLDEEKVFMKAKGI